MVNRLYLIGGAAVAALGVVYYAVSRNSQSSDATASYGGYPIVYSTGGTTTPSADTSTSSTDTSISQLLASQLSLATVNQQTQLAGYQAQKDLATISAQSALDLGNLDLTKTKTNALANIWTSLFGAGGAGSLNVAAPENVTSSVNTWDNSSSTSGGGGGVVGFGNMFAALPSTPSTSTRQSGSSTNVTTSSGAGYTQGSIYGTIGFDQTGNIAVNINRQTASSLNPLPGANSAGSALKAA